MTHVSLFSGIGGIDLAAEWAGFRTVLFCEQDKYCQKVLKKHWPDVPIIEDIFNLSVWELGKNDGLCYNKLCEAKNKKQQILKICNWLMMPREKGELKKSVASATRWCPYLQALQTEVGNIVLGNVVQRECEEKTEQMQMVELGCEEKKTPIGKMGKDMTDGNATRKQKFLNGEEESLQETITLASHVGLNQSKRIICEHTTSNSGQNIQKNDLNYLMELLYAKYATTKCTRKSKTIDLLSAGIPCQPASIAGKRRGKEDDRWLWPETYRIIRELLPKWIVLENVSGFLTLNNGVEFENALFDLEGAGYEVQSFFIPAVAVEACHQRSRVFIIANTPCQYGITGQLQTEIIAESKGKARKIFWNIWFYNHGNNSIEFRAEDKHLICGEDDGVSHRVDRLKCLGNAVVPQQVYPILRAIAEIEGGER